MGLFQGGKTAKGKKQLLRPPNLPPKGTAFAWTAWEKKRDGKAAWRESEKTIRGQKPDDQETEPIALHSPPRSLRSPHNDREGRAGGRCRRGEKILERAMCTGKKEIKKVCFTFLTS